MMMFAYEWEPAGVLEKGTLRVASLSFNIESITQMEFWVTYEMDLQIQKILPNF